MSSLDFSPLSTDQPQTWLVLPAAGVGSRMQADRPKQYLSMTVKGISKTVIEHTLDHLLEYSRAENLGFYKVVVVVTQDDPYWQEISQARGYGNDSRILVVDGGSERCYSVLNALMAIDELDNVNHSSDKNTDKTWVAVHDVARPCLSYGDLDNLFSALENYQDGGILAAPVRDTMKRGALDLKLVVSELDSLIDHTVEREQLWHALTPQMFPLKALLNNLQRALKEGFEVTDEASAMEYAGARPKLVNGRSDNLKITRPEDLKLAEFYLNSF
ncbi:2-C-methyl-D-erythritol 4-phosphate cytidylyltransferase [Oleispira antarctica]|uniref:2-C-methyl-D-erythritol 4-phosphate cytidylyltransferase n=1 Tax=Oleispira antarctica TaxID=188908 RepID=A0A1Y5HR47_OLEAN|nr:2-C-methyl-D-erythritol 4-phosphate cytidylyltransferase [Oleispira antarctica]